MTGPTKSPETGTDVALRPDAAATDRAGKLEGKLLETAQTFEQRQLAFTLADQVRQAAMIRKAAEAMAEFTGGKEINPVARAAVARYMLEIGGDPLRHVFILGGNIYLNAEFYRELAAANPDFVRDTVEFIHDDKRTTADEKERRRALRIQYGVPEEALGAAIVTLHYRNRGPFIGVNWAGARANDPVGKSEPTKTAHSRAYRKAAMKAEPAWFKTHPRLAAAEQVIAEGRAIDSLPAPSPEKPAVKTESTAPAAKAEPGPDQQDLALDREIVEQDGQ